MSLDFVKFLHPVGKSTFKYGVAEWIGMSEAWLEQCRFRKIGIPFIEYDRACRYRTSDVQKWIDTHVVGSTE